MPALVAYFSPNCIDRDHKERCLWLGTLVVAFAIGAVWIGCVGWLLNGLIA
jgi:hypothetical protein